VPVIIALSQFVSAPLLPVPMPDEDSVHVVMFEVLHDNVAGVPVATVVVESARVT